MIDESFVYLMLYVLCFFLSVLKYRNKLGAVYKAISGVALVYIGFYMFNNISVFSDLSFLMFTFILGVFCLIGVYEYV